MRRKIYAFIKCLDCTLAFSAFFSGVRYEFRFPDRGARRKSISEKKTLKLAPDPTFDFVVEFRLMKIFR